VNTEPEAGLAVRVTLVPLLKVALQVLPQLIPAGALATVPVPLPEATTLSCAEFPDDELLPPQFTKSKTRRTTADVDANSRILCVIRAG